MAKTTKKTEIRMTVDIKPVRMAEVTPHQRQLAKTVWTRLIAAVKDELKAEDEEHQDSK